MLTPLLVLALTFTAATPPASETQVLNSHNSQVAVAVATPSGQTCLGQPLLTRQVKLISNGHERDLFPPLVDNCFPQFGYSMPQWFTGTVSYENGRWYGFPTYATRGWDSQGHELVFPSTSAYDAAFPGCMKAPGQSDCYLSDSHMAQTIQIPGGLFVLTSERAVIYNLEGLPVADLTWESGPGSVVNGGRNYGSLSSFTKNGQTYVVLIGGCTTKNEADSSHARQLPTGIAGNCSIHHHVEIFQVDGLQIVSHRNIYYGYSNTDGYLLNRLEVPANPIWAGMVHFNRFDGTQWLATTLDPTDGTTTERQGFYVWGKGYESRTIGYYANKIPRLIHVPDTPTRRLYDGRATQFPTPGDSRYAAIGWEPTP